MTQGLKCDLAISGHLPDNQSSNSPTEQQCSVLFLFLRDSKVTKVCVCGTVAVFYMFVPLWNRTFFQWLLLYLHSEAILQMAQCLLVSWNASLWACVYIHINQAAMAPSRGGFNTFSLRDLFGNKNMFILFVHVRLFLCAYLYTCVCKAICERIIFNDCLFIFLCHWNNFIPAYLWYRCI